MIHIFSKDTNDNLYKEWEVSLFMLSKMLKYLLLLIIFIGVAGTCTWFLAQWILRDESVPKGVMKVLGNLCTYVRI